MGVKFISFFYHLVAEALYYIIKTARTGKPVLTLRLIRMLINNASGKLVANTDVITHNYVTFPF